MEGDPDLYQSYAKHKRSRSLSKLDSVSKSRSKIFNGKFFDITEQWKSWKEPGEVYPTGQNIHTSDQINRRFGEYSLLLRRKHVPEREPVLFLEIQSSTLRAEFSRIATHLRNELNLKGDPIKVEAPYHQLYHVRQELNSAIQAAGTEELKQELLLLRSFEKEHLGRAINEIELHIESRQINYEHLWALFKPGELVILQPHLAVTGSQSVISCGVLKRYDTVKTQLGSCWLVIILSMDICNGRIGAVEHKFEFPSFTGLIEIDALPVYPLAFCPEKHIVQEYLMERGKSYIQLSLSKSISSNSSENPLKDYNGPIWIEAEDRTKKGCDLFDTPAKTIRGRVLVDPRGFANERSHFQEKIVSTTLRGAMNIKSESSSSYDTIEKQGSAIYNLDFESLMSFPPRIAGYSLLNKDIGHFLVDSLREITWEEEEAKSLLTSNEKMDQVCRIVSGFTFQSHGFGYSIGGKGRGLVFLFSGPPGCGKTLTAECVSEYLHRPLYRVSGTDLGPDVDDIESSLQLVFDRAARWEAILLLDEADAFMSERKDDSLERNRLVSTLLRLLEYQSGVAMLTSNREKDFDPAFHSRIHVRLQFTGLTKAHRQTIWHRSLTKANVRTEEVPAMTEKFSELELDGRRINNIVRVAELFANSRHGEHNDPRITLEDIKSILGIALGHADGVLKKQVEELS
ncbi:P-loop containing nucleoside triphosphate hydrolase protein [Hypoxylon fuscum]|nr:P-loop containing nucleoside triphosphate hydrolase protein [Hypoxylon fuscum]